MDKQTTRGQATTTLPHCYIRVRTRVAAVTSKRFITVLFRPPELLIKCYSTSCYIVIYICLRSVWRHHRIMFYHLIMVSHQIQPARSPFLEQMLTQIVGSKFKIRNKTNNHLNSWTRRFVQTTKLHFLLQTALNNCMANSCALRLKHFFNFLVKYFVIRLGFPQKMN